MGKRGELKLRSVKCVGCGHEWKHNSNAPHPCFKCGSVKAWGEFKLFGVTTHFAMRLMGGRGVQDVCK
jgi:hypothetical protein